MTEQLTVGSLFSGIGGLDLGLERAGMKTIWQSEIEPYCCKVLNKHWPEVPNHGDIKKVDWSTIVRPDVICGGYPCQPFSLAGKRAGEHDPRHLWPWVCDAISKLRPRYAVLENVRGHLSMGGTTVVGELASIGYDAEWHIVPAASVGAPHRRDRIFIVAYPNRDQCGTPRDRSDQHRSQTGSRWDQHMECGVGGSGIDVANTDSLIMGQPWTPTNAGQTSSNGRYNTQREVADVSGQWWQIEPDVGRVVDGVPNRVDRLRGLGNAVVPQVAQLIGTLIIEHNNKSGF